jgi:hypothetical protein
MSFQAKSVDNLIDLNTSFKAENNKSVDSKIGAPLFGNILSNDNPFDQVSEKGNKKNWVTEVV